MWTRHMFVRRSGVLGTLLALLAASLPLAHTYSAPLQREHSVARTGQLLPLGSALNADGTLRPMNGYSGSLDTSGWNLTTDDSGAPRFVPTATQQTSEGWDPRFGVPGVQGAVTNARVYALAIAADGSLYVGGDFDYIGHYSLKSSDIARWDGQRWHALGSGVNGPVNQLAVSGNEVYAVGDFTRAGAVMAKGIAHWNGRAWAAVGTGVGPQNASESSVDDGRLYAVAVHGSYLYVGGDFNRIDGVPANTIARWNGRSWSALGRGIGEIDFDGNFNTDFATVRTITPAGGRLYVGGRFNVAGQTSANAVAAWNGTTWTALGSGLQGSGIFDPAEVRAIAVYRTTVYVGGRFVQAGGKPAAYVAQWTGGAWSALGSGITPSDPDWGDPITSLLVKNTSLYVGGDFVAAGGNEHRSLARWNIDSGTWSAVAEALGDGDDVRAIVRAANGTLYVGGDINQTGPISPNDVAALTPRGWRSLGQGFGLDDFGPGKPSSVAVDQAGRVYVGGTFLYAGGVSTQRLAQWDGDRWYDLGSANGSVDELLAVGNYVYAAGQFTEIGGITANHIARWHRGTRRWTPLGAGTDGAIHALAYHNGLLYVGGAFKTAGTVAADDVAYWNGSRWHTFGKRFRIYERGDQGGEIGTYVNALYVVDDKIFIGGKFQTIYTADLSASALVNNVVLWNRTADTWSPVGIRNATTEPGVTTGGHSGLWTFVNSLVVHGNYLYAGGSFTQAGKSTASGIARWNAQTNTWSSVKAGVAGERPVVNDLAVSDSDVWVAGDFTTAGNVATPYLARFNTTTSTWWPLGRGTRVTRAYSAEEVVATPNGVYWVGIFEVVGGLSSSGIARWKQ